MTKKIRILSVVIAAMALLSGLFCCASQPQKTIKISGAFALYPMMSIWAEEYQKINPDVKIEVSGGGAGKGMADAIQGLVDIGMVSRDIYQAEIEQGIFWVSVTKDAVVATINNANPALEAIRKQGVSGDVLENIFISRKMKTWGEVVGHPEITDIIKVYTRSDACGAAKTWAKYLNNHNQDDLTNAANAAINGDPNLMAAIQNDPLGIGFNNINFVYDAKTKEPLPGIQPAPIDLNGNGILDMDENFYGTRDAMVKAIAEDIYPSPPARALHLVFKKNCSKAADDFMNWILTDGQKYISDGGYIPLPHSVIGEQITYLGSKTRPECGASK